jgi:hypothetical protein
LTICKDDVARDGISLQTVSLITARYESQNAI